MSTSEDIEYDREVLKAMSQKDLTYQLLCWKHLERPKRQKQLEAQAFYNTICDGVQAMIDKLAEDVLTKPFADLLAGQLESFIDAKEDAVGTVI